MSVVYDFLSVRYIKRTNALNFFKYALSTPD